MSATVDTIWKFSVPVNDRISYINMPVGAEIVHVGSQNSLGYDVQFWVTMAMGADREVREFLVVGTGQSLPKPGDWDSTVEVWVHRGTVLIQEGRIVLHLMERVKA